MAVGVEGAEDECVHSEFDELLGVLEHCLQLAVRVVEVARAASQHAIDVELTAAIAIGQVRLDSLEQAERGREAAFVQRRAQLHSTRAALVGVHHRLERINAHLHFRSTYFNFRTNYNYMMPICDFCCCCFSADALKCQLHVQINHFRKTISIGLIVDFYFAE